MDHSYQVWLNYVQWFSRRISKCKKLTTDDGRTEGRRTQCEGRGGGGGVPTTGTPWIRQWLSVNLFLRISTVYSTPRHNIISFKLNKLFCGSLFVCNRSF